MADFNAELRHLIEQLVEREVEGQATQRGWSFGWDASQQAAAPGSVAGADTQTVTFATGFDGTSTIVGFLFDVSAFNGADQLL